MATKQPDIVRIVHTADVHFGAVDPTRLMAELRILLDYLANQGPEVDLFVICGDLFHKKISMNDPSGKAVIEFMNQVMYLATEHEFAVRIVKGTLTHDFAQLENFRWMEGLEGYNFRIINSVQTEEIFPDYLVLWIPEEYLDDPDEYYREYFDLQDGARYDTVFLHGSVDFLDFSGHLNHHSQGGRYAPVFRAKDLSRISRGPVLCGHIHGWQSHKDKVYYPGSYTRWVHGEEDPKYFIDAQYEITSGNYEVGFVENSMAPQYSTVSLDEVAGNLGKNATVEQIADAVTSMLDGDTNLRIMASQSSPEQAAAFAVLRERFADVREVRVEAADRRPEEQRASSDPRFDFIRERKMPLPDTIIEYIRLVHGAEVPRETVEEAIST
jgi:DNA repair exonuclease SbcCD nuclease subunit